MTHANESPKDKVSRAHDTASGNTGLIAQQLSYSGPLPPSSEMERYERICPGSADRILSMSEKEQLHRHAAETRENQTNHQIAESNIRAQDASIHEIQRGQWMALVLGLAFLVLTGLLGFQGHEIAASALGLGGVAAVAAVFIKVRKQQ